MIERLGRRYFTVRYNYTSPVDRQRAVGMIYLSLLIIIGWVAWNGLVVLPSALTGNPLQFFDLFSVMGGLGLAALLYYLVQSGRLWWASMLVVGYLVALAMFISLAEYFDLDALVVSILPITAAGLLLSRRELVVISGILLANALFAGVIQGDSLSILGDIDLLGPVALIFIVTAFFFVFSADAERVLAQTSVEMLHFERVGRFSAQAAHRDENAVYKGLLSLARYELGYSFAQVFLPDESGSLNRRLRLGVGGAEGGVSVSSVNVSEVSALVEAMRSRQPVEVSRNDNPLRRGHFLSPTNYGVAIPILIDETVIGVLDVQDMEQFSAARIAALEVLAGQAAAWLTDIRMVNALRADLTQQAQTVEHLRAQLRELKQTARQTMGSVWDAYLGQRGRQVIGFDIDAGTLKPLQADDVPATLQAAVEAGELQIHREDDHQQVIVPIILQEEVLGAMTFTIPESEVLSEKRIEMARNVANRLALALDNRRLFEQSQSQALRERKASEIAGLLIGATEVDTVLSLAAENFNQALGAVRTRIHLQPGVLAEERQPSSAHDETPTDDEGGTQ
jgi:GAF domain-containing protein